MTDLSGKCLCGAVGWQTAAPILWAGHCHCNSCRRACSAPFTSFFGVERAKVSWRGPMAVYASSAKVRRGFCATCGTQMYYQNELWPTETHLYAASLEEPTKFSPQAHYHWVERLPWVQIADDLPKFAASAEGASPVA